MGKILYDLSNGNILHAIHSEVEDRYPIETNIPYGTIAVDESVLSDKTIFQAIYNGMRKWDANSLKQHYVDIISGELMERAGWQEKVWEVNIPDG